jgi:hypothetical protein
MKNKKRKQVTLKLVVNGKTDKVSIPIVLKREMSRWGNYVNFYAEDVLSIGGVKVQVALIEVKRGKMDDSGERDFEAVDEDSSAELISWRNVAEIVNPKIIKIDGKPHFLYLHTEEKI